MSCGHEASQEPPGNRIQQVSKVKITEDAPASTVDAETDEDELSLRKIMLEKKTELDKFQRAELLFYNR